MEEDVRKELQHVEGILEDIRENTSVPWWRTVLNGLFYGGGVVLGTVLAIAALGWLLSLFGVIPGLGEIVIRLQDIMNSKF